MLLGGEPLLRAAEVAGAGTGRAVLQVEPGAEAPPGTGEHDDPHRPVGADGVQGGVEVGDAARGSWR